MKLALVTGGAKGIGKSIASRLLDDGMDVAVLDCAEPSGSIPGFASSRVMSLARKTSKTLRPHCCPVGGVDVLVNNAGIRGPTAPVSTYPLKDWEAVLKLNLTGPFLCCQLLTAPDAR